MVVILAKLELATKAKHIAVNLQTVVSQIKVVYKVKSINLPFS